MNGSGTGDHLRSFAYDALSRLIASYNPESTSPSSPASRSCPGASGFWATCYAYDNDSNIANKTDNRGITTTYSYDPLDRLLSKTYTDSTPSVSYTYDTYAGTGGVNDVGNPTMATVSSGSTVLAATVPYAYDPMGRLTLEAQCTPANCVGSGPAYNLAYTYNLGGKLTSATFPSNAPTSGSTTPAGQPVTLSYAYDNAERLLTVSSSWADSTTHPATLFQASTNSSAPGYGPMGIENADLGIYTSGTNPTLNLLRSYDDRGRLNYEAASSSAITGTDSSGGTITIGGSEQQVTEIAAPGTTTFYVEGAEGSHQGGCILYWPYPDTSCETYAVIPDGGGFTVTVTTPAGPITASGGYGSSSTTATVAQSLAASFTSQGFPATVTGSIVKVQANTTGLSSNYSFTVRQTDSDFSLYGGTPLDYLTSGVFTGGWTGGTFYDTGYIHARVSGTEVDVPWSQGSTPASLATSLAAAINSAAGTFVMATANGATVNLTSLSGGPETDYTVTASVTDTNPFYFSDAPPSYYTGPQSFSVSTTNMSGGQTTSSSLYSFLIPVGTGYWPNGDLLHVTDSVTGTWSYGYDGLNRLGGAVSSAGPYAGAGISWSYDPFGNRTSQIVSGTPSAPMPTSNTASYTAASNQVSTSSLNNGAAFSYDAAGDVTYDGLNSYLYDAEGRLCAVKNYVGSLTGYVYDAAGARVAKGSLTSFSCNFSSNGFSTTSSYVLEPGGNQVTEYSVSGATSTWVHTNAFDAGGLVASYHDTATYFNVPDWLGTKRAEVGTNGCTSTFASMPYGDGLTASGNCPDATEHHFTGKERDQESGNDYFGARYYASRMGSWMSPDWSAKIEPVPYAKLDNPQSLNLYAYLENNPVDRVDPNGHCNPNDWGCNPWDADYGKHFLTANEEAQRQQIAYNINNFDKIVNAGVDDILNSVKSGNVGGLSQYVYDNATIALNSGGNFEAIGQARYNIGDELGKMLESSIHDEVSTFLKTAGTTGMEALAGEIAHHDRMSAPSSRDKGIKWAVDKVSDKLFGETMPYLSFAYKWLQRAPRSEETHDDAIDQIDQHLGKN